MENLKFIKSKIGYCIYLDDNLFTNDKIKYEKLMAVLELFSFENLFIKSEQIIKESEHHFDEIIKDIDCTIKTLEKRRVFFGNKKCRVVDISFEGNQLSKVVEFAIKNDVAFEADCYDKNEICLQLLINGSDGSCIHFNNKKFDMVKIKEKTRLILNDFSTL